MSEPSEAEKLLDAIEAVDDIIVHGSEINALMRDVVRAFVDLFDCDRAFLSFYKPSGRGGLFEPVVFSRLEEDDPTGLVFESDGFMDTAVAVARDTEQIGIYCPETEAIPSDSALATRQGVRSLMIAAVQPRLGPGWYMGTHDCGEARTFRLEPRLMSAIAARMADAMTLSVAMEHIRASEDRIRTLVGHAPGALMIIDVGTQRVVDCNTQAESQLGWGPGQLLGAELRQLHPDNQADGSSSDERITLLLAEVATGGAQTLTWTYRRANRETFETELELVPLPDSERLLVRASFSL